MECCLAGYVVACYLVKFFLCPLSLDAENGEECYKIPCVIFLACFMYTILGKYIFVVCSRAPYTTHPQSTK